MKPISSRQSVPLSSEVRLADVLSSIMSRHGVDETQVANQCSVTYQTVKNALRGRPVNARFVRRLIDAFHVYDDNALLRLLLLSYLAQQLGDRWPDIMIHAGLIRASRRSDDQS